MTSGYSTIKVEVGFGYFGLDTTVVYTDLSAYWQHITTSRGKSGVLDEYQGGTATITFKNQSYDLDPSNPDSPYATFFNPMTPVKISANDSSGTSQTIFMGFSAPNNGWSVNFGADGRSSVTTLTCVDIFTVLQNFKLPKINLDIEPDKFTGQFSGEQLYNVLSANYAELLASWFTGAEPNDDAYAAGKVPKGRVIVSRYEGGTTLLEYVQKLAKTEGGALYTTRAGLARYDTRYTVLSDTANTISNVTFNDSGANTDYREYQKDYGSVYVNVVTGGMGDTMQYTAGSRATNQIEFDYDINNLFWNDMAQVIASANWYVLKYASFTPHPFQLVVDPRRGNNELNVIKRELRDKVTVKFRPPSSAAQENEDVLIRSIAHEMDASAKSWSITVGFEPLQYTFTDFTSYMLWGGTTQWDGTKYWAA